VAWNLCAIGAFVYSGPYDMGIWDRALTLLDSTVQNNSLREWLIASGIALAVYAVLMLVRRILGRRLQAAVGGTRFRGSFLVQMATNLAGRIHWFFILLVAVYVGTYYVDLPARARNVADAVLPVALFLQITLLASYAFSVWAEDYARRKRQEDPAAATALTVAKFVGHVAIWTAFLLLALENLGFDVNTLVAGLGIGGVAIAFALQNILGDLFASVSIILDKPFETGDFIIVGDKMGTVEKIGIKTVRVRSLSGEQLVFSNNDLLQSRIHNYKRMNERRVLFTLGVTYQTPSEKLERLPQIIREAIESQEKTRFDRSHFRDFGNFSLNFEAVYYVLEPDYNLMMDIQQNVNLAIVRAFEKEGVEFAYPTQTLYVQRLDGGQASE
jgi:small-conductance mechanosensitive channel